MFAIRNDINGLNPFVRTTSTNVYVRQLAYESLLDFDKHGKLVPSLAESWTLSPDGKSYVFKLRKGVKFHDGKELSAEDVKWSVDYAMDPNNGTTGLSMLKSVERVNVKDKLAVEVRAEEPARGISQHGGDDPSVSDRAQSIGAKRKTRSARISTGHRPVRIQRLQAGARDRFRAQ